MLSVGSLRGATGPIGDVGEIPATNADDAPVFQECGYFDVDQVGKIAHLLLVSLATACVEKTSGDPFNNPGAVVGEVKKEMLDYLNVQSDAFATGSSAVVLQVWILLIGVLPHRLPYYCRQPPLNWIYTTELVVFRSTPLNWPSLELQ